MADLDALVAQHNPTKTISLDEALGATPALDFQPAKDPKTGKEYPFKVAVGPDPNGNPATIRDDGAINFPGQNHWLFYDPKTKQYAPAPSEPWKNKGMISGTVGADALAESGRNFGIGTERAVNAGLSLAQRAVPSSWQPADQAQTDQAAQLTNAQRIAAINATQRESAKKYQDIGQAAPAMVAASLAPVAGASFLARALPGAATFGTATGITTEGDLGDRAKAAGLGAGGALLGQGVIEKGVPLVGQGLGAITSRLRQLGNTPAVQELLATLESKLAGKTPGVAIQDAANKVYDNAWQKFMRAITPVDEAATTAKIDYSPAVNKGKEILGIGVDREPGALTEEGERIIRRFYDDIAKAGQDGSGVSNSFKGGMNLVKRLTAAERQLAQKHGDLEARDAISAMKEAVLDSMGQSNPNLTGEFKSARELFKREVAPLFDKSEGGDLLTRIRDTPRPNDVLAQFNQGSLARMQPDAIGIIAKGSSPDPILYSILNAAKEQAKGKPGSFATSIEKAMPAIQKMAEDGSIAPEMLDAFKGLAKVANTARFAGFLANLGGGFAVGGGLGAIGGAAATISPKFTGPGLIWSAMQSPATRKLLSFAGKMPAGSPELELIAKEVSATVGRIGAGSLPKNITPLRPQIAPAAGEANPQVAQEPR